MWARIVELMLGCWLVVSPFVFRHGGGRTDLWVNDLAWGSVLVVVALLCHWRPLRRLHLLNVVTAGWLLVFGYTSIEGHPAPPHTQNHMIVGLLVLMLAVIPSAATRPPPGWTGS